MHAVERRPRPLYQESKRQPHGGGLCESKLVPLCIGSYFILLRMNIYGYMKNNAEFAAHLKLIGMPSFVGITETWLTNKVGIISIPGYTLVSRKDRSDGRQGGGIVFFARDSVASQVVHVGDSVEHERSWHILHTDVGAFCIGLWYRPPEYNETESIYSLGIEYNQFSLNCIGTIIVGDMNVNHKPWLTYSNGISPEGRALFDVCGRLGLQQCVRAPRRNLYLLDLVLTDVEALVKTKVLPKLADHNLVLSTVRGTVTESV